MCRHSIILALGLIGCCGVEYQGHFLHLDRELTLADVYGNVTGVARRRAASHVNNIKEYIKSGISDSLSRHKYLSHRASRSCNFPIDLLIVQDATGSFETNFKVTANRTLPAMAREIPLEHPGSTFSMITFRDKPVPNLGEEDDDCVTVQQVGATDPMELAVYYETEEPGNGWDTPENQYGALMVALTSPKTIPWHTNPLATPIIVMVTDSRPHFHGDSQHSGYTALKDWPEDALGDDQEAALCSQHYYPSPEIVRDALWDAKAYMSTIIVRPAGFEGAAVDAWRWFNSFVGYPDSFVQLCDDDDEGWEIELQHIIDAVEGLECGSTGETTSPSPTAEPEGSSTSGAGAVDPAGTEQTLEECECKGQANCGCWQQPDIYVALYKRAKELDIHMRKEETV